MSTPLSDLRGLVEAEVFARHVGVNVKLAEAPSFGQTIFEYAPESSGARDYRLLAEEVLSMGAEVEPKEVEPKREEALVILSRAASQSPVES